MSDLPICFYFGHYQDIQHKVKTFLHNTPDHTLTFWNHIIHEEVSQVHRTAAKIKKHTIANIQPLATHSKIDLSSNIIHIEINRESRRTPKTVKKYIYKPR